MTSDWQYDHQQNQRQEQQSWVASNKWRHSQGDSETSQSLENEDKFRNCSTLGTKRPLPLDDRKELLLSVLARLQTSVSGLGSFPRAGPSGSGAPVVRPLRVMNTDEELEHLIKRQRILELRTTVARTEVGAIRDESSTIACAANSQAHAVRVS